MRGGWIGVIAAWAGIGAAAAQNPPPPAAGKPAPAPAAAASPAPDAAVPPPLIWRYGPVTQAPLPVGEYYHDWARAWAGGHGWLPQTPDGRFVANGPVLYDAARPATANAAFGPALVSQPAAAAPRPAAEQKAVASSPPKPAQGKREPITAVSGAGPGGAGKVEYDIVEYTSRFDPADKPEDGVRRWLLAETGNVWNDVELAYLSVTAERVKAYHSPEVQRQVAATLGRFLHFTPGQFRCRVRVMQTGNVNWRRGFESAFQPLPADNGGQAWLVPARLIAEFAEETGVGLGNTLLWDQTFLAPNGQRTLVEMTPGAARDAGSGVAFRFSPLIAGDLGADIEYDALGRKQDRAARSAAAADDWRATANGRSHVPAGHALLVSLGRGPGLDDRIRLLNPKPETLVLLEIAPERGSKLAGKPLATAPDARDERAAEDDPLPVRRALSPRRRQEQRHEDVIGSPWR